MNENRFANLIMLFNGERKIFMANMGTYFILALTANNHAKFMNGYVIHSIDLIRLNHAFAQLIGKIVN